MGEWLGGRHDARGGRSNLIQPDPGTKAGGGQAIHDGRRCRPRPAAGKAQRPEETQNGGRGKIEAERAADAWAGGGGSGDKTRPPTAAAAAVPRTGRACTSSVTPCYGAPRRGSFVRTDGRKNVRKKAKGSERPNRGSEATCGQPDVTQGAAVPCRCVAVARQRLQMKRWHTFCSHPRFARLLLRPSLPSRSVAHLVLSTAMPLDNYYGNLTRSPWTCSAAAVLPSPYCRRRPSKPPGLDFYPSGGGHRGTHWPRPASRCDAANKPLR